MFMTIFIDDITGYIGFGFDYFHLDLTISSEEFDYFHYDLTVSSFGFDFFYLHLAIYAVGFDCIVKYIVN